MELEGRRSDLAWSDKGMGMLLNVCLLADTPVASSGVKMRTRLSTGTLVMNGTSTLKEKDIRTPPSTPSSDSSKAVKGERQTCLGFPLYTFFLGFLLWGCPCPHNCLVTPRSKLQALVYDILPSTIAIFSYAIWSRKLSANKQFLVGAQTVVSLLQTTQIVSNICFITDPVCLRQLK